jgi:ornithine--oxo-acid transaminase
MKNTDFINLETNYSLCRNNEHSLVFQKGEGVWLWDVELVKFLDLTTLFNYAVFGHSPERLVSIMVDQAKNLSINTSFLYTDRLGPFLKKLASMTNDSKCAAFSSTTQAYHELIRYSLQWSSHVKNLKANEAQIAYVSAHKAQNSWHEEMTTQILCHQKSFTFDQTDNLDEIGGKLSLIIVDPIDLNQPNLLIRNEELERLSQLAKKHQALLVIDESFCPPGVFGKNFVSEFFNPKLIDGVLLGEYLGAGLIPVCALCLNQAVYEEAGPMTSLISSVYPVGAAIALESLCVLEEMYLADKALEKGIVLKDYFLSKKAVDSVHSSGLLFKVKISPDKNFDLLYQNIEKQGLFIHAVAPYELLISPALTMNQQEMSWMMEQFDKLLDHDFPENDKNDHRNNDSNNNDGSTEEAEPIIRPEIS